METNLLINIEENKNVKTFEKYLLQINRIKLIDYIEQGLITPDRYLSDECEKDIQSKNNNFLVLSDGYLQILNEEQILIELALTSDEIQELHIENDICYLHIPLPISRIRKIYVQDKDVLAHIEARIKKSESGFLPNSLFEIYTSTKKVKFEKRDYIALSDEVNLSDYRDKIRIFDKRMGMFTFMKNTNLYYNEKRQSISNYSDHYFSALSLLLKETLDDKSFKLFDILNNNKEFKTLLFSNNQINEEFVSSIVSTIEDAELKEIFLQLQNPVGVRKTLASLLEKNALNLYMIALVYYFRDKDSNRKDSFKIEIKDFIPYEIAEVSLAILGLYFGYKKLRASENIEIEDKVFKQIFGNTFPMKFTLESKLDYITIETIYNACFKEQRGYEYEYLSYPKIKPKVLKISKDAKFTRWYEIIEEKEYFDQKYIKIRRKTFEKNLEKNLEKLPEELNSLNHGILLGFVLKYFPNILSPIKFGEKLQISCKKNDLYDEIKSEQNQSKREKVLDLFDLNSRL